MPFAYNNTNKYVLEAIDEKSNRIRTVLCCNRNGGDDASAKRICWSAVGICAFNYGI